MGLNYTKGKVTIQDTHLQEVVNQGKRKISAWEKGIFCNKVHEKKQKSQCEDIDPKRTDKKEKIQKKKEEEFLLII